MSDVFKKNPAMLHGMPTDVRNAIQFLAFCLRDKAELKLNFKHVAAWRYSK